MVAAVACHRAVGLALLDVHPETVRQVVVRSMGDRRIEVVVPGEIGDTTPGFGGALVTVIRPETFHHRIAHILDIPNQIAAANRARTKEFGSGTPVVPPTVMP